MIKVCPNPIPWKKLYQQLCHFAESKPMSTDKPPSPLILSGWNFSNDKEKQERWKAMVRWANQYDCDDLLSRLSDSDFYFTCELTDYQVGPMGGPLRRPWDYEQKKRPRFEDSHEMLSTLKANWEEIGGSISLFTSPKRFSGNKLRRLVVSVTGEGNPPWGNWDNRSSDEEKRRSFTFFRKRINDAIKPMEVDHVSFELDKVSV